MSKPVPEPVPGKTAVRGQHARASVFERDAHSPFPIVAVGASAGGLDAFRSLLASLSPSSGMAYVLVQHLDPHHESRLVDLLSGSTEMPVLTATNGLAIRPNHVYV